VNRHEKQYPDHHAQGTDALFHRQAAGAFRTGTAGTYDLPAVRPQFLTRA